MSHILSETNNYDATVTVPDDGDSQTAASVAGPIQSLTNRTKYLGMASQNAANKYPLASRSITRMVPLMCASYGTSSDVWVIVAGASPALTWTAQTSNACPLYIPFTAPNGATLTSVVVTFAGSQSNTVVMGNPTSLKVYKRAWNSSTQTQIGSTWTDPYTNTGTFKSVHQLTVSGLSETIDNTANIYWALVTSNSGSGTPTPGDLVYSMEITFTTTAMDDGAA